MNNDDALVIGVFFNDKQELDYPLNDPDYRSAYVELGLRLHSKGAEFWMLRDPATYVSGNTFQGGWRFERGEWVRHEGRITVDLIYNKGSRLRPDDQANILNKREMDILCRDKMRTVDLFPDLFPRTALAGDEAEALAALARMRSSMIVLKPSDGWGGKSVWIGPKNEASKHLEPFPVMIQEFIDTSGGIPGYANMRHDFRIILSNGLPLLTFLRIPAENAFISNVAKGGHVMIVPPHKRPMMAIALAERVDREFKHFGNRMYSVDCGLDASGEWKLIELNDQPGLMTRRECGEFADDYYESLADFLLSCATKPVAVAH